MNAEQRTRRPPQRVGRSPQVTPTRYSHEQRDAPQSACEPHDAAAHPSDTKANGSLIVFDLDDGSMQAPRLTDCEARALHAASARGVVLAAMTQATRAVATRTLRDALNPGPDDALPLILPDTEALVGGTPDRAFALARLCRQLGLPLSRTTVIAGAPADLPPLLEAGRALALEDAGPACRAAAERTFGARAGGALVHAIRHAVEDAPRQRAGAV